jgi:WhiB family redox-sensing transcriptional regulator
MTHALTPERIGEMLMGAVTDAEPWRAQAACAGEPADVFFPPEVAGPGGGANYSRARLVCAACPVQDTCLEYALANHLAYGMWGGASPKERVRLQRQRRRSAS